MWQNFHLWERPVFWAPGYLVWCVFVLLSDCTPAGENRSADDNDSGWPHAHWSRQAPENHWGSPQSAGRSQKSSVCAAVFSSLHSILHILCLQSSTQTYENLFVFEALSAGLLLQLPVRHSLLKMVKIFVCLLQQARELVVKLIRDKDQGDFRVGRADFGSKMGGSSLDVRFFFFLFFKCWSAKIMWFLLINFSEFLSSCRWLCPGLLSASSSAGTERWSRRFRMMLGSGSSSNKARN